MLGSGIAGIGEIAEMVRCRQKQIYTDSHPGLYVVSSSLRAGQATGNLLVLDWGCVLFFGVWLRHGASDVEDSWLNFQS